MPAAGSYRRPRGNGSSSAAPKIATMTAISTSGQVRLHGMAGIGTDGHPAMINPGYELFR